QQSHTTERDQQLSDEHKLSHDHLLHISTWRAKMSTSQSNETKGHIQEHVISREDPSRRRVPGEVLWRAAHDDRRRPFRPLAVVAAGVLSVVGSAEHHPRVVEGEIVGEVDTGREPRVRVVSDLVGSGTASPHEQHPSIQRVQLAPGRCVLILLALFLVLLLLVLIAHLLALFLVLLLLLRVLIAHLLALFLVLLLLPVTIWWWYLLEHPEGRRHDLIRMTEPDDHQQLSLFGHDEVATNDDEPTVVARPGLLEEIHAEHHNRCERDGVFASDAEVGIHVTKHFLSDDRVHPDIGSCYFISHNDAWLFLACYAKTHNHVLLNLCDGHILPSQTWSRGAKRKTAWPCLLPPSRHRRMTQTASESFTDYRIHHDIGSRYFISNNGAWLFLACYAKTHNPMLLNLCDGRILPS
ncbi:hypothetical protein U9M48_032803, partial [Paspalum notatum var. saurae]